MINEEKGASKSQMSRPINGNNSMNKSVKVLRKEKDEKGKSKNTKILDFFPTKDLLAKKHMRFDGTEEDESDNEDKNFTHNKKRKEVIDLLDDSRSEKEIDSKDLQVGELIKERKRKNRESCSICRHGGDLLLCDNCPKSFHTGCLKMKEAEVPEGDWYCPGCIPIIERRKQKLECSMTLDERKKIKREKRRIYRLKRKEEMRKSGTTTTTTSHSKLKTLSGRKLNGRGKLSKLGRRNISSSILAVNNFSNPINLILSETDNETLTYSKYGTNSILPIIPVISDEIQTKIIEEQMRLDDYLIGKFKSKTSFLTPGKFNNKYLDNFLNLSGKSKKEGDRVVDSIDLTEETSIVTTKFRSNILPTEEEAKKVLSGLMKNNLIDYTGLNQLSRTNPILHAKVNNLYLASLRISNNTNNNLIPVSQSVLVKETMKKSVKFPIEDSELYKNPEAYSLPKEYFNKPEGSKLLIPNEHISRIFKIWDFMHSFKSKLKVSEFTPEQLYFALNHFTEEEIPLLSEIHSSLISIMGEQITSIDSSVLMNNDDFDLTLFKIGIENPSAPKRNVIYKKCWIEVIKMLINSKMFNLMVTEDLSDLSSRLKYVDAANYNLLSFDEKITMLEFLLNTVMSSEYIRTAIKEDMEKRSELNKEKTNLQNELKAIDSRKREIERQEKFTQPQQKVDGLTKKLITLVEDNPEVSRQGITKLRKDLENQREQFRSVIKEGSEIDNNRNKYISRIEKLSDEIYECPSTNKKLIGKDGFRNEYYFFPQLNNKLYVKKFINRSRTNIEWSEFTSEEEIKELLSKLTDKGINEKNLIAKINKILTKRLKLKKNNIINIEDDKMMVDDITTESEIIKNILSSAIEWRNSQGEKNNNKKIENVDPFEEIAEMFGNLEEKITNYFFQDDKEWEALDMRRNFKAWLSMICKVPEYAKAILLFNYRFKHPYKINDTRSKIIDDEDEYSSAHTIFNSDNTLQPFRLNKKRTTAAKARLWSKDLEGMDEHFINYVNSIISLPSLYLGLFVFESVFNDLTKRREIYKKKDKDVANITSNFDNDEISSSIKETNNNNNTKNNKLSEYDDFYYDESLFNNNLFIENEHAVYIPKYKRDLKANNKISKILSEPAGTTRSKRLSSKISSNPHNTSNINNSITINTRKRNIDWNDECSVCGDPGDLVCCEECPNVAHLFCVYLKKQPDEWRCEECNYKLVNKRQTRSNKH